MTTSLRVSEAVAELIKDIEGNADSFNDVILFHTS